MKAPAHLALNPFGQIPTWEEEGLALFESGAIVLHVAERSEVLLPREPDRRARAISWMFAALNTVEPPIVDLSMAFVLEREEPWFEQRQPLLQQRVRARLDQLSRRLGESDWLEGEFSAGDLLMVNVLLRLRSSGLLGEFPRLSAYVGRGEERPAFRRAFDAQLAVFANSESTG